MGVVIDRDLTISCLSNLGNSNDSTINKQEVIDTILKLPTIDLEEVKWESYKNGLENGATRQKEIERIRKEVRQSGY